MEKNLLKKHKNTIFVLKVAISLSLMIFLVNKLDFNLLGEIVKQANLFLLLISFLIMTSTIILSSYKWKVILNNVGEKIPQKFLTTLYFKGVFFNNFLPTNIGGDGYKFIKLSSKMGSKKKSFISIFSDRFSGILVLLPLFTISLILFSIYFISLVESFLINNLNYVLSISSIIFILALFFILVFKERINFIIQKIKEGFKIIDLKVMVLSLTFYLIIILNNYLIGRAYNLGINVIFYFIFIPIILLLLFLPISFNGIGIRELSFTYLFSLAGVGREEAILLGITTYILLLLNSFIGGSLLLLEKKH